MRLGVAGAVLVMASSLAVASEREPLQRSGWRADRLIGEMAGPEDLAVYEAPGGERQLLISAYDRRRNAPGAIWLRAPGAEPRILFERTGDGRPLRPHGIAVARLDADGVARLFVVHHGPRGARPRHTVEVFRLDGAEPGWEASLSGEAIVSPNDLVATPAGDLYVTNEANYRGVARQALEFFHLRLCSFVAHGRYAPGKAPVWERIARGPRYSNGIEVAADRLFVAATLDRALWVFARDPRSGEVGALVERIEVGSGVDNLTWGEEEGLRYLFTAAHPDLWAFLRHARDANAPAPAEVWRIDPRPGAPEGGRVERVFHDPGERIQAAATGLLEAGELYVGQVFGHGVLVCRRSQPALTRSESAAGSRPGGPSGSAKE